MLVVLQLQVWFGFFVLWHVNLRELFDAKTSLLENSSDAN